MGHFSFGTVLLLLTSSYTAGRLPSPYSDPHCDSGRQVIVHLFMWKWTDIAAECERFLFKKGYCAVQMSPGLESTPCLQTLGERLADATVRERDRFGCGSIKDNELSPPQEHAVTMRGRDEPWWDVYQPVSYKLHSRMGNRDQLVDMVSRCNKVGVRVYVDAVINHMAAVGARGNGTDGTAFNGDTFSFPGVPYNKGHFSPRNTCPSANGGMDNTSDANNTRNCELLGLRDLDQSQEYVQDRIAGYLNSLIDIGVAGFRVDASKHIWPKSLEAILAKLKDVKMGGRPFFYHEVTDLETKLSPRTNTRI